eukprot:scaffold1608_cov91-Cylindrotheca_fusiformis.AAC.1
MVTYLPFTWLTSVRAFLKHIRATIIIAPTPTPAVPSLCRQRDQYLMEMVANLPRVTKAQLQIFNSVRIYLQVTLLSEITTADGKKITLEAWQATRAPHTSTLWPYQEEPTEASIRVWQTLLHHAFLLQYTRTY